MRKDIYTPLSQANTDRIRTDVEIPFGGTDKVGLNTRYIEQLLQLSGFGGIKIVGDQQGEVTKSVPQIAGMDSSGTAIAAKAKVDAADTHSFSIEEGTTSDYRKQARWDNLSVTLNMNEMSQRIRAKDKSVRDASEWASQINISLQSSILRAGLDYLLSPSYLEKTEKVITFLASMVLFYEIESAVENFVAYGLPLSIVNFLISQVKSTAIMSLSDLFDYGFERKGKGRRWSLFYGIELDRAVALGAYGVMRTYAKELP